MSQFHHDRSPRSSPGRRKRARTRQDGVMRIVIAPDSFKGTASATEAAAALAAGWASARPGDDIRLLPMADGGEGTLDAFEAAVPGAIRMPIIVTGPDDRPVRASWLLLPGGVGVVELASTSGLTLLDALLPHHAHTLGFGQAIAAALDHGVERLLLAIGGSSSSDGGTGALAALGARFLDDDGAPIPPGNAGLAALARIDLGGLRMLPPGGAQILSDVSNPLLGERGAARVFGPQKGADAAGVEELERNLARLARVAEFADPSVPGAGAAGGTGFGLQLWGAVPTPGAAAIADALGLPAAVERADLVVTGEGRFDEQSAAGKVPGYVAGLAAASGARCLLVAGSIIAPTTAFENSVSLESLAGAAAAMAEPLRWLREAGAVLAAGV